MTSRLFRCLSLAAPLLAVALTGCPDRGGQASSDAAAPPDGTSPIPPGPVEHPAAPESWSLVPHEDGTLDVVLDHAKIADFKLYFWGKDWVSMGGDVQPGGMDGEATTFTVPVEGMGMTVNGRIEPSGPGVAKVTWVLEASRDVDNVIGAAVEMSTQREIAYTAGAGGEIALQEDGTGWTWPLQDGERFAVEFTPKVPYVYFEQADKSRVRGVLFRDKLAAGTYTQTMLVKLPSGGRVQPPAGARFGSDDAAGWHPGTLHWDHIPVDVEPSLASVHHRPAGKHGRVEVNGDALQFADGTPARFWGTNVVAYSLFAADEAAICRQADRLAAFGYNLVRLHHHDSKWVEPNIFAPGPTTQELSSSSLRQLDWWITCLSKRGVYVWLDLHTGRTFKKKDKLDGWGEISEQDGGQAKGYSYVNPTVAEHMKRFARDYLGHRNIKNGVRYADDPAVVGVLITNENDLTQHHGNFMNSDAGHPIHRKMMAKAAKSFIDKHKLPGDQSLDAWRPGPAKLVMAHLEHQAFADAITNVRSTGYSGPIATTNMWGDNRHWSLPSLTTGDLIDVHAYDGELELEDNPHHAYSFVQFIAGAQVEGKPLTVTEWNLPAPVRDRYTGPLWIAAMAALQGWDAPMHYAYAITPLEEPYTAHQWSAFYDPAQMALMPAAAVAYRLGHISGAKKTYRIQLTRESTYGKDTSVLTSAALRTLPEQSRVVLALPDTPEHDWDTPAPPTPGATTVKDLSRDFLPRKGTTVTSDTGEIVRDWGRGILTVDTPGSQWAVGWLGGETITLGDAEIRMQTKHAGVTLTALDGAPLASSKKILLSTIARAVADDGKNRMPIRAEPVRGIVSLATTVKGPLELVPLMRGHVDPVPPASPVPGTKNGDRWDFQLPADIPTHWFLIRPVPAT